MKNNLPIRGSIAYIRSTSLKYVRLKSKIYRHFGFKPLTIKNNRRVLRINKVDNFYSVLLFKRDRYYTITYKHKLWHQKIN